MELRNVEIKRNFIERTLMSIKDYVRNNKKVVIYSTFSVLTIIIIVVSGIIYYQTEEQNELAELEQILYEYKVNNESKEGDESKSLKKTIDRLKNLINSSYWGFVNNNGYYIIADLYQSENMVREANEYFLKFVKESPKSFFAPLALKQAGILYENIGEYDEAFKIYKRVEKEYRDSIILDEIYYNIGRLYQNKGRLLKAREYYNKLIIQYPQSIFIEKAKNRMFLLGYLEKRKIKM